MIGNHSNIVYGIKKDCSNAECVFKLGKCNRDFACPMVNTICRIGSIPTIFYIAKKGGYVFASDSKYNFSVISITGQIDCDATLWWNSILSGLEIGSNIAIWCIAFSIFSNNRII